MPVFTDALLGDTMDLSAAEFGAYMLILIATWRNNGKPLPDDDVRLARTCRTRQDTWSRFYRAALIKFFDISDGFWHQKRLEKEWRRLSTKLVVEVPSHDTFNGSSLGSNPLKSPKSRLQRARATKSISKLKNPSSSSLPVAARACVPSVGAAHARDTEEPRSIGSILGLAKESPPPPSDEDRRVEQRQRHARYLIERADRDGLELYYAAQLSDDPSDGQRMFELTEARLTAEGWEC
jgi:uncharacterized protein YdaU (DUF1376 family)